MRMCVSADTACRNNDKNHNRMKTTVSHEIRRRVFAWLALPLFSLLPFGCMEKPQAGGDDPAPSGGDGLFILSEGSFNSGNASLSYYDPADRSVENEVFYRANGQRLGDTGQSMTYHDGVLWVVVNGSHVIFAVDPVTFREKGRVTAPELTSPRCIRFVTDEKAYVTQLFDSRILIVDPSTYSVTGTIETGMDQGSASTEGIVMIGNDVFVNCWSYQKSVLKIDSSTDEIVASLEVGVQPESVCADTFGRLWALTDGGAWEGNPAGYEAPKLVRIDPESFTVETEILFNLGDSLSELQTDASGENLYFLRNGDVWKMSASASELPSGPFIDADGNPYSFTVSPETGEIYVSDAVDYQQNGAVVRYSAEGVREDEFTVGICPGSFCWAY